MNLAREKAPEHVLVTPDEIGIAMAELASPRMRKVTGGTHFIDGGFNIIGG
jgi:enoyl-[acyl-carrier protein] reductase I